MARKDKRLDKIVANLRDKYGKDAIKMGSEVDPVRCMPIGIPNLDTDLGGGFTWGHLHIIAGKEACGKTSLALKTAAAMQALGTVVFWFDVEKTFNVERARLQGVDLSDENFVLVVDDLTAENLFQRVRDAIIATKEAKLKCLFVIDSLAASMTERLVDKPANEVMAGSSLVNNSAVMVWVQKLASNQMLLMINQLRDNLKPMARIDVLPGGRAQLYMASTIMYMRQGTPIKAGNEQIGLELNWTMQKTKNSAPKEQGFVKFIWETGFDVVSSLIDAATELEVLKTGGGGYFFLPDGVTTPEGESKIRGKETMESLLRENPEFVESLTQAVYKKLSELTPVWNGDIEEDDETE